MRTLIVTAAVATVLAGSAATAPAQLGGRLSSGQLPVLSRPIQAIPPITQDHPAAMPAPAPPVRQFVPEQRQFDLAIGRNILVPQHDAELTPDGRLVQPPMAVPSPSGGPPVFLPGGVSPGSLVAP